MRKQEQEQEQEQGPGLLKACFGATPAPVLWSVTGVGGRLLSCAGEVRPEGAEAWQEIIRLFSQSARLHVLPLWGLQR